MKKFLCVLLLSSLLLWAQIPAVPRAFDAVTQAAAIGSTTLFTTPAQKGMFRISLHARVTRAATSSSTLGPLTVTWTDVQGGTQTSVVGSLNSTDGSVITGGAATGNATTSKLSGVLNIDPAPATAVTFTFGYASSGATAMQYQLHLRAEQLGVIP